MTTAHDTSSDSPSPKNVDPQEVAKFEAMSTRWWDKEGEFKPLHDLNPTRLAYIKQRAHGLAGKKVLDVGCGGGILSESMAHEGADVTGIDMGMPISPLPGCIYMNPVKKCYTKK